MNTPWTDRQAWKKLTDSLSEAQRQELERTGCFTVTGSRGGRFTIGTDRYSGNIIGMVGGFPQTFCCHHGYETPLGEHLLAQALLIRTDETAFRNIAILY